MANDESISDTNSGDESILEERLALGDTGANLDNSPNLDETDEPSGDLDNPPNMSVSEAFLGAGVTALAVDRTSTDIATKAKTFPKESREDLKKKDFKSYLRMVEFCKQGLTDKFSLLEPITEDSGPERLAKSYDVLTREQALQKGIEERDMEGVFKIPLTFDDNGIPNSRKFVNLLDTCHGVKLEQVKKASSLYALKSSAEFHPQNISWSGKMILNSMETDLKEKVLQAAEKKVDKALHGGPIYLFFMHKLIMATSETAMRGLTDKITSLKLTSFKGENVHTAGNYLKGALKILERHEKTPQDINLLLFRIFSNCSTKAFTKYMENIESTLETDELFDNERKMTAEDIILAAENKYADLLGQDKWEAKSTTANQESTFTAETSDIICFNCGGIGHTVAECPQPKNDEMILRRRKIILNNRNNSGGAGRGNGGGRGRGRGRGGRGRGRGRGRGGRNGGRGNGNNNENETEDSNLKKPPKPTEAHTKKVNGKQLHWCGRCAKWTGHDTASHKNNDEGGEVEDTPPAEGNLADINALSFRGALCSSLNC